MLIDALHNYIRYSEQERAGLLQEGAITLEEARAGDELLNQCKALLRETKDLSFDGTL
jgi:hypothetical protein